MPAMALGWRWRVLEKDRFGFRESCHRSLAQGARSSLCGHAGAASRSRGAFGHIYPVRRHIAIGLRPVGRRVVRPKRSRGSKAIVTH